MARAPLIGATLLLVVAALATALPLTPGATDAELFGQFKHHYRVVYQSAQEEAARFVVFTHNLARIRALDAGQANRGVYGITRYADMTPKEFAGTFLGRRSTATEPRANVPVAKPRSANLASLPTSIDWPALGGTTHVYNQGQCGSCWAFSTTEQVETMWWVKHGQNSTIRSLSPQQIVDCDRANGDDGCNGGDTTTAYEYVIKNGGLEYWVDYPYEGVDEKKCHWNKTDVGARVKSWSYVTKTENETQMLQYVGSTAPASICVNAVTWQFYIGGVIKHICGPNKYKDLDHCVQLVGYGDDMFGTPYWLIRNSWGDGWGEAGYLKVERNKNLCGVADEVTTCDVHETP